MSRSVSLDKPPKGMVRCKICGDLMYATETKEDGICVLCMTEREDDDE